MEAKIKVHDKIFRKYIDNADIQATAKRIAAQIDADYAGEIPVLLNVLEGSTMFMADLMSYINIPVEICSMKCTSYSGMNSTQEVKLHYGPTRSLAGRRVIVVEDIVDTGLTIDFLYNYLPTMQVKDIRVACMAIKPHRYNGAHPIYYKGITLEDKFVVGHGLDYDQLGRNYVHIYQLDV